MPSVTISSPDLRLTGAKIEVFVSPSTALRREMEHRDTDLAKPIKKLFMIDTGASSTIIKQGIAQDLGLLPKGQTEAHNPAGQSTHYTYDVDLLLPENIQIPNLLVCEASLGGQDIDGLIGRDVLQYGVLLYNGKENQVTFAV